MRNGEESNEQGGTVGMHLGRWRHAAASGHDGKVIFSPQPGLIVQLGAAAGRECIAE